MVSLITIKIILLVATLSACTNLAKTNQTHHDTSYNGDKYSEQLYIRPLSDGKLLAHFKFNTLYRNDISKLKWENKFQLFPSSIAQLVSGADLTQLHFSITRGNWNQRNWGRSPRPSPAGAEIAVLFSRYNENPKKSWSKLVNLLGGKFCSSLASADETILVKSKLGFRSPTSHDKLPVYYAALPEENLCTENITPFKKLLPCYNKRGLSSLLNAVKIFKSSYSSIALDLEPHPCNTSLDASCQQVMLTQSITIIFNPLLMFEGKQAWSITKMFGTPIKSRCPVASNAEVKVDITSLDDIEKLYPKSYDIQKVGQTSLAVYDINSLVAKYPDSQINDHLNVGIKQSRIFRQPPVSSRSRGPIELRTHVAGRGGVDGTIVASITNNLDEAVPITYMDALPYFLRIYLNTLTIRTNSGHELKPDETNFQPSEGKTPTLIEFSIQVPPKTQVQVSYKFERAFLRWSDHRPDANKGTLIRPTSLIVIGQDDIMMPHDNSSSPSIKKSYRVYARPLLVILPTPDFSMPYNVINFVCNVLVIAFIPLFSLATGNTKPSPTDQPDDIKEKKD